jgi:K+-sensing histidine kinase KdpD
VVKSFNVKIRVIQFWRKKNIQTAWNYCKENTYSNAICKSQMHLKEVILDNSDISKAIIEYATSNAITDIVVGASTKNTFIRYMTCLLHFHGCTPSHPVNAYTDSSHDHYTMQKIQKS